MYKIDKMLVALDLSNMDDLLIRYAAFLVKLMDVEKVYFTHAMEQHDMPEQIEAIYPDLDKPLPKLIKEELDEKVKKHFADMEVEVDTEVKVMEEGVTDSIIQWVQEEPIDLVLVGKKTGFKGRGMLAGKLVRLVHCSVMFVPETVPFHVRRILVPVDFSQHSRMALEEAVRIADKTDAEVICSHVYTIPRQYFPYIPSEKNVREEMKKSTENSCDRFVGRTVGKRSNFRCVSVYDPNSDAAQAIYDQAISEHADLIIVGSKGRTNAASVLLGSTAEKLTGYEKSLPILIVKSKKENLGFINALFGRG